MKSKVFYVLIMNAQWQHLKPLHCINSMSCLLWTMLHKNKKKVIFTYICVTCWRYCECYVVCRIGWVSEHTDVPASAGCT